LTSKPVTLILHQNIVTLMIFKQVDLYYS